MLKQLLQDCCVQILVIILQLLQVCCVLTRMLKQLLQGCCVQILVIITVIARLLHSSLNLCYNSYCGVVVFLPEC